MSPAVTMTAAIAALVAEKRATGYKYATEEQVLARFAAFSASRFPGIEGPPTRALGRGVDHLGPRAGSHAGDAAGPGRSGAGAGPVDRPGGRAGLGPARRGAAPARPLRPRHSLRHRPGACGPVRPDRPLPLRLPGPVPAHLVMPVLFRTIYACGLRVSEARLLRFADVDADAGRPDHPRRQGRQGPAGAGQRGAA